MTRKSIIMGVRGVLEVKVRITSEVIKNNIKSTIETGYAQIKPSDKERNKKELFRRAILDASFHHFDRVGLKLGNYLNYNVLNNEFIFDIIDYKTKSIGEDILIKVKRKSIKIKAKRIKENNHYVTQITDDKNNIIETSKWEKGEVKNINSKKTKTYYNVVEDKKSGEVIHFEKWKIENNIKLDTYENQQLLE